MDAAARLQELSVRLSEVSIDKEISPSTEFSWPEASENFYDQWFFTPELISLYPLAEFELLSLPDKRRLSLLELINFFSINIHGEKKLIQGMIERLYLRWSPAVSEYLHHFIAEENKHMSVFAQFCLRYGDKIYPSKQVSIPRQYAVGEEDLLFFSRVVLFEEFVDSFNKTMGKDVRLAAIVKDINWYHHIEEGRHLSFGRSICRSIADQYKPQWDESCRRGIVSYLNAYVQSTWKEYYNPKVYSDFGFENGYDLYERAWSNHENKRKREEISIRAQKFIDSLQLI